LIDAGLAVRLETPVYMDQFGDHVEGEKRKTKIKGLKVKVDLLRRPEMCLVLDEVGSNLNMVNDGHVGGQK
jgi:hypothetical protein